ncbi:alcohol dehydrogenase catalytic domain-containing protein [Nocardioides sp. LHD-245]|uniref:alcohol dehydrogenase catalytic domain-containing protein n=1 Tax=Nocardioides sp. LHD-245 TaxID=3051387 RepID=UPI0027DEB004|nr:alcohol dehydrogenase catalytic domain-containing protein [Nocardioides sp. LHD-245]
MTTSAPAATETVPTTMRAARLHDDGGRIVVRVDTDVAVPDCGRDEVLIKVRRCGLNQVDLLTRSGQTPQAVPLPHISGTEVAGDVVAVGTEVDPGLLGARVVVDPVVACGRCRPCFRGQTNMCRDSLIYGVQTQGGYAEYAVAPARQVLPIPTGLSYDVATAIAVTGPTTWHMLHTRARLRAGETVLVIAAGSGIGTLAAQVARFSGARVVVTVGGEEKVRKARELLPADLVVDHHDPTWPRQVRAFNGGHGADLVFEHVGASTWQGSLAAMARGGRLVTSGGHSGFEVDINLWHLFIKEHTVIGSYAGSRDDFCTILDLVERGIVRPIVQQVFALEEIAHAQRLLEKRRVFGKLLLDPSATPAAPAGGVGSQG